MLKKIAARRAVLFAGAAVLVGTSFGVDAQTEWPTRPVTIVVQAAAGGGIDVVARRLAEQMKKSLGQSVVVENRGGAGGAIGAEYVARSAPDGYTLLIMAAGETYYKVLNPGVKFDVTADFTPIAMIAGAPLVLVANSALPIHSLAELVSYAKANPGKLSYGTPGVGSPHHVAGEMLAKAAQVDLLHVPYRGTALAVTDVLAGQVSMVWSSPVAVSEHIGSGKLRAIALADSNRILSMPNVPTISELGYPDVKFDNWFGLVGPNGMPAIAVKRLHEAVAQVGRDVAFTSKLKDIGFQSISEGPEEFAVRIRQDRDRYTRIAQGLKAKAQ